MKIERKLIEEIGRLRRHHIPSYSRGLKRVFRRYLGKTDNFDIIVHAALRIPDSYYSAEVISYIAARGALEGLSHCRNYFPLALKKVEEVPQEWRRAELLEEIARRIGRAGGDLDELFNHTVRLQDERHYYRVMKRVAGAYMYSGMLEKLIAQISRLKGKRRRQAFKILALHAEKMNMQEKLLQSLRSGEDSALVREYLKRRKRAPRRGSRRRRTQGRVPVSPGIRGMERFALGLYNTYRGSIKTAQLRAVARAAPLCHAYGMKLVLLGFHTEDPEELIERVSVESRISGCATYLKLLREAGHLLVFSHPGDGFLPGAGELVAATPEPQEGKRISLEELVHLKRDVCIVMGLGRRGLPGRFLETVERHVELTGHGIPLETCTVMGIICERLRSNLVRC
ncbi:DUF531 family protein [Candidatus Pyrohabitans sp.]